MKYQTVVLACALLFTACGKSSSKDGADKATAAATGTKPAPDANAAEQAKLGAAIECLNRHSNRVFEARDAYLGTVDDTTGKPDADRNPTMLGLYGVDQCKRLVTEAGKLTPANAELDGASAAYVAALEALIVAWEKLTGYYQKGENLDDKGKQAETLHPAAMTAYDGFIAANAKLDTYVRELNRKRRVEDLAAREKAEGRKLEVIIDAMMLEAETLVAVASATPPADPAAFDAQIKAYGTLVDEFHAYAGAHDDEAKQRGSIQNLKNYSQTFLAATKVIARKRAEAAEPSDSERSAVIDQFNSLVENYNRH